MRSAPFFTRKSENSSATVRGITAESAILRSYISKPGLVGPVVARDEMRALELAMQMERVLFGCLIVFAYLAGFLGGVLATGPFSRLGFWMGKLSGSSPALFLHSAVRNNALTAALARVERYQAPNICCSAVLDSARISRT